MVLLTVVALAAGLGVGLTQAQAHIVPRASWWQPKAGVSWDYPLGAAPASNSKKVDVIALDLVDNTKESITELKKTAKVICYFSAGSYEDWRPDASSFSAPDLGKELDGWPGERWLNINSANVHMIMKARLDSAVSKGCDGVDPDNVDGYDNDNGMGLTQADAVNYLKVLAKMAHERGLAIGLKNAGAIIPQVISYMDWSVNEQCVQFEECSTYQAFIKAGKPVFHVEYPKGDKTNNDNNVAASTATKYCDDSAANGFSTIIKNMNLDSFLQPC